MTPILDTILQSPRMPQYVQELVGILEAERADRANFHQWLPDDKKAEFINGRIFVHSPVRFEHDDVSTNLLMLLKTFARKHDLGHVGHEKLLVALTRNDYEPDIAFWGKRKAADFSPNQMKFPAPDLIVEILSPSTQDHDRGVKFDDYAAHGVGEYWIVDADKKTIEQYFAVSGTYQLHAKVGDGTIHSRAIAGLALPAAAAFDPNANLQALSAIMTA